MKKKMMAAILTVAMTATLAGCSGGTLSNDYVTINQYDGLEVQAVASEEVTDTAVESYINSNLSAGATEEDITDRAAEAGDYVDIDYVGSVDGVEFDGGAASGAVIELGNSGYVGAYGDYQSFDDQIIGHSTGEEFDITIQFPEDYSAELANQVAVFHIKLNRIFRTITPELTDEWVKENSEESETVEDYQAEIRKQLEEQNQSNVDSQLQSLVISAFLENVEVKELPQEEVDTELAAITNYYESIATAYGLEFADFLSQYMNMDEETFQTEAQSAAENAVKLQAACELLADKKNLEPSEAEYDEEIAAYAASAGYEDVESFTEVADVDALKASILQQKVAEYLAEHCVQVEAAE